MGFIDDLQKYTSATLFLLRGLGKEYKFQALSKYGFINAYIGDIGHEPLYEYSLYLLFKPENYQDFQYFLNIEKKKNRIVDEYDYEGGYTVLVYNFPEQFHHEYDLFKTGDFSLFRKSYVDIFPEFEPIPNTVTPQKTQSLQWRVFHLHDSLREYWEERLGIELDSDAELWSRPDLQKETLDIRKFETDKLISNL